MNNNYNYFTGKLEKLDDGRWCIRLKDQGNIGFFIHPYENERTDFIENEYYSFALQLWNSETDYCAFGLEKTNSIKDHELTETLNSMWEERQKGNSGIKEIESKLIYDIDFEYIKGMAERMQLNRDKYPVGNWTKPIDIESLKQALFRHTIEIMQSNYSDEQKFGHLYAIGCNAFMIINQLKNENL